MFGTCSECFQTNYQQAIKLFILDDKLHQIPMRFSWSNDIRKTTDIQREAFNRRRALNLIITRKQSEYVQKNDPRQEGRHFFTWPPSQSSTSSLYSGFPTYNQWIFCVAGARRGRRNQAAVERKGVDTPLHIPISLVCFIFQHNQASPKNQTKTAPTSHQRNN